MTWSIGPNVINIIFEKNLTAMSERQNTVKKYVYIYRYQYIFWNYIVFAVFLATQTIKFINPCTCKWKVENHIKLPQMTLKWPWVTFKWPCDPRQLFHWLEHLKCFKSCQTFASVALIVLVLLRKNLIFHCFLGRWPTLGVYIYMNEHFPRYDV